MRPLRFLLPAVLLLPLLSACASLSEDQCRAGDWETVGLRDGAEGRTPDYLRTHARACNEYGVAPVRSEWERGRQIGLRTYCTPRRAWEEGADGHRLSPVCPAELEPELRRANARGLDLHEVEEDIDRAESDISHLHRALASLPAGDARRAAIQSEIGTLRLRVLRLRAERARLRFY